MTAPVRLQLSRRRGFDLRAASRAVNGLAAASVARPSRWGNPFPVARILRDLATLYDFDGGSGHDAGGLWGAFFRAEPFGLPPAARLRLAAGLSVAMYEALLAKFERADPDGYAAWLAPLAGHNLACWCGPGEPCHADVLLELANGDRHG